jgi:AcrR family transcriptional regulator
VSGIARRGIARNRAKSDESSTGMHDTIPDSARIRIAGPFDQQFQPDRPVMRRKDCQSIPDPIYPIADGDRKMVRQAQRSAATIAAILAAARALFRQDGYGHVSVDDITAAAGYTKGAFYHHFQTKREVFDLVVDQIQQDLAEGLADQVAAAFAAGTPELMAQAIRAYLDQANAPANRRTLLVDGPVVLGWARWREIDDKHFAGMVRTGVSILLGSRNDPAQVEASTRLILGAIMEAALAASAAKDPAHTARAFGEAFTHLLGGLRAQAQ